MPKWPWQKQIGWEEIGEDFIRFTLLKTPLGSIYLHRLIAPLDAHCHDHPWNFLTIILRQGYWELHRGEWKWWGPGTILYRRAEDAHVVATPDSGKPSWSLVFVGRRLREWSILENGCR